MADADKTYDVGDLDGIAIEMETIEDGFEKAIAEYEYPFADGVDTEDMGEKGRTVRVRCFFWDDAEQSTYSNHITLINNLSSKSLHEFTHPKYGLLKGRIKTVQVRHNDLKRYAEVDLTIIEQMRGTIEPQMLPSIVSSLEEAYVKGQEEQQDKLASDLKTALPGCDVGAISKTLSSASSMIAQVQEYTDKTRAFVSCVEGYISMAEAVVDQAVSPVNSLQATITYSLTLPGRILGSVAGAVEKVAVLYDSLKNYPTRFLDKLDDAFDDLADSFKAFGDGDSSSMGGAAEETLTAHLEIAAAQRMALEAASLFDADETAFREGTDTDYQVMNIRELETALAIVRQRIETAVEQAREITSLKAMAESLLIHVNQIRLEREKMLEVVLDNPMPLHLVCLKYGLAYTDAERLLKVNRQIRNPNFTAGEVSVYAR
jgi:prophage DNA circulation protein